MDDTGAPPPGPPGLPVSRPDLNQDDVACLRCGYNLRGLRQDGVCPECGTAVARSLEGDLLVYSSPDYTASLHRGVALILAAIIAQILVMVASFAMAFTVGLGGAGGAGAAEALLQLLSLGASIAMVAGWWLFSAPDPGMLSTDKGDTPRKIVRITVVIQAISVVVQSIMTVAPSMMTNPLGGGLMMLVGIASLAAMVVGYFAQMLYVKWLAPRLPSERVFKRARTLLWLGPVLYTVGLLLLGLGPLIALILYWNMLDWVRRDLKRIREEQAAGEAALG
ncbi:MAG: hypothetical protein ACF8R7_12345 [Phycisphaerales bacterium JB039]